MPQRPPPTGASMASVSMPFWISIGRRHLVVADQRADYGEPRWLALGLIGDRLHSLAFTIRGERIRIISLRTASRKERMLYEEANGR